MNGRFRSACIRWASRIGKRVSVKFAEEKRASDDSGGRPCLQLESVNYENKRRISRGCTVLDQPTSMDEEVLQPAWLPRLRRH